MSAATKIGLLTVAIAIAVVGFLIAQPEDEDAARTTAPKAHPTEAPQAESPPAGPSVTRIRIRGGAVVGGAPAIAIEQGNSVRIVVAADAADELHLHGYDITRSTGPGKPAQFGFEAKLEGSFELESHSAEDAGKDPLVARLVVAPS